MASAARDGFLLELWVEPKEVAAGQRVFALVRVSNVGTESPTWESNTCGTGPAPIVVTADNDIDPGKAWEGNAALFKQRALESAGVGIGGPSVIGHFWEANKLGSNSLCTADSRPRPFAPGQVEVATLAWDVKATDAVAIQSGVAKLTSTFTSDAGELTVQTTIQITTGAAAGASLVDLIDVALAEPSFKAWLDDHPGGAPTDTNIVYWPNDRGIYPQVSPYAGVNAPCVEIGGFYSENAAEGFYGAVVIDLATRRVIGTRFE